MPPKSKSKDNPNSDLPNYRVRVGINYPGSRPGQTLRADPGDVVNDIPTKSLKWLLEQHIIEEVS